MEEIKIEIGARRTRVVVYEDVGYGIPKEAIYHEPRILSEEQKQQRKIAYAASNYIRRLKMRREVFNELVYNNFAVPNVSFITLTFDDSKRGEKDYTQLQQTHREFKNFILRMNRRYEGFKYVATFGRQENGNWHYHILCNLDDDTTHSEIEAIWKLGYVWIEYLKNYSELYDKASYCIRNMNAIGFTELQGEKGYLCSKNLQRNIILRTWKENELEECQQVFHDLRNKPSKLLYTASKVQGIKTDVPDPETGEIYTYYDDQKEINETLKNFGYTPWVSKYHHISSGAKYSERFQLLPTAKKINKRKGKRPISKALNKN